MAYLINLRWIDVPEEEIYNQLIPLGITSWECKTVYVEEQVRQYLFGEGYAYPYSLPVRIISKLAKKLNNEKDIDMTWYKDYNIKAMAYFEEHREALNQALEYWEEVGDNELPKPEILPSEGFNLGTEYIAIIGVFHLTGQENDNNSHLYIELIDINGNRIYDHYSPIELKWGWDGMGGEQIRSTAPVRIDKPLNEPGTNIGITWNQVIYGFGINHIPTDRFKGIHIRYENDGEGNDRGHHSHYIVLQKRIYQGESLPDPIPDPDPTPDPIPDPIPTPDEKPVILIDKSWLDSQEIDENNYIKIYKKDV